MVYNKNPRPAELELSESLETTAERLRRDGKRGIRLWKEDFSCPAVTVLKSVARK
jgi:hypothetical protein